MRCVRAVSGYLNLEGSENILTVRDTKFPIIVPPSVTIQEVLK